MIVNNDDSLTDADFRTVRDALEIHNLSVEDILQQLAPSCDDMLLKCKWKGEEKRCKTIFEQVKTPLGYCCAFNYFAMKNHSFSGWENIWKMRCSFLYIGNHFRALPHKAKKRPRKVSACGYQTALEVLMDSKPNDYFTSLLPSAGHYVIEHK